jgi:hypothetical protein
MSIDAVSGCIVVRQVAVDRGGETASKRERGEKEFLFLSASDPQLLASAPFCARL